MNVLVSIPAINLLQFIELNSEVEITIIFRIKDMDYYVLSIVFKKKHVKHVLLVM